MPDRPDVKIKNGGLGQYGAAPHYSTLPFWQLCALKGQTHRLKTRTALGLLIRMIV